MQNKRPEVEVLCGVNGDFCYGGEERLNLLHGIMYKDGVCLKDTFDGGSVCTVFAMMKDGTAKIMNQSQYASQKNNIQEAVGGRQALIVSGQTVNFTDTRLEPRTAVGVSKDGDKVYLLIVDGRRDAYSIGASYALLAQIFHIYNVYDAINLDGGGSSTFLVKDATANKGFKTRNRPTDNTGDRKLPNGLAVVRKK
jgi:exopolysaccharide biosynthesis protein